MVKRVESFSEPNKEAAELMNFIQEEERISQEEYIKTHKPQDPVINASMIISEYNPLSAMVQPFWGMLSKDEKIEIIKLVAQKYGDFKFAEMKEFGIDEGDVLSAIYTDDVDIMFNTTTLSYEIDPCYFLASILSAKNEVKQRVYENKFNPVNSILDFENIHELKARLILTDIDTEKSEEEKKEWLEAFYDDMPIYRARKYAIIAAAQMLMEEADTMKPLTNEFIQNCFKVADGALSELRKNFFVLDATDEELATVQKYESIFNSDARIGYFQYINSVLNILQKSDRRRDAWYVLNANDSLKRDAEENSRSYDYVDEETALAHFGLDMNDVELDEEAEDEVEETDEFEGRSYDA